MLMISKISWKNIRSGMFILRSFCTKKEEVVKVQEGGELAEKIESGLMDDNYEKVQMEGLKGRQLTGVSSFQRSILGQNKFDLLDERIEPKMASMRTKLGLITKSDELTEIDLGRIKVKAENQIFLSEVDPNNIPEYYNIVFDYEKQMTLVGRRIGKQKSEEGGQMKISTAAFQEKSEAELKKQVFGVAFSQSGSKLLEFKRFLVALFLAWFFTLPVLQTTQQVWQTLQSIKQIEKERLRKLDALKREGMAQAVLKHPDLSIP